MTKAVVTHRVWFKKEFLPTRLQEEMLAASLVECPFRGFDGQIKSSQTALETRDWIGLPRSLFCRRFARLSPEVDLTRLGFGTPLPKALKGKYTLRPDDQSPDVALFLKKLEELRSQWGFSGGIFKAWTGYGKSVSGMEILLRLGGNALIIVHQEALLVQWKSELEKWIPGARIGMVQGQTVDYHDAHIVVATVQTLWQDGKLPKEFFSSFRTVLIDEIHRHSADKFAETMSRLNPTYFVGMSGTIRRGDRMEGVFHNLIGEILHTAQETNRIVPQVFFRETGYRSKFDLKTHLFVHKLKYATERTDLIANDIVTCLSSGQGRNPVVMSSSLALLRAISERMKEIEKAKGVSYSHGFYVGGLKKHQREAAAACQVMFATIQLAKEGIDIPRLDTLFLASPVSDPEQMVGRICRRKNENAAVVIDYVDSLVPALRQSFLSRLILYRQLNWPMSNKENLKDPVSEFEETSRLQMARPLQ